MLPRSSSHSVTHSPSAAARSSRAASGVAPAPGAQAAPRSVTRYDPARCAHENAYAAQLSGRVTGRAEPSLVVDVVYNRDEDYWTIPPRGCGRAYTRVVARLAPWGMRSVTGPVRVG